MTTLRTSLRTLGAIGASTLFVASAWASSHREAPLIAQDPTADSTDVYVFLSPDAPDPGDGARISLIANYIPFQAPAGGPNYFNFADSVLYEIKVDNTGDAIEDVVFQFRFETEVRNGGTFLYNTGPIEAPDGPNRNVVQRYTVTRIDIDPDGTRNSTVIARDVPTAPANIGPRSNPDYPAVAAASVWEGDGYKLFAGPRDEGFYLDINAIFDLINISRVDGLGDGSAVDGTAGFNVNSIAIELPVTALTADGSEPTFGEDAGGENAVLGVWTTASRRKHRALRRYADPRDFGPWIQVSRLSLPLINEVVVPLEFKDQFNRTHPADDLNNIAGYVVDPELSRALNALYDVPVPPVPRADMVEVIRFLPGIATTREDLQPADLMRINVSVPAVALADGDRLGVIAGDFGGFPNGRRPGDDVVDILERVVGGGILSGEPAPGGGTFGETFPNNALNDAVDNNDVPYLDTFPWLGLPHQGFIHFHDNPEPPDQP